MHSPSFITFAFTPPAPLPEPRPKTHLDVLGGGRQHDANDEEERGDEVPREVGGVQKPAGVGRNHRLPV